MQLLLLLLYTVLTVASSLSVGVQSTTSQNHHPDHDVIIVGGSITGLATAVSLKTQLSSLTINTQIYERATSLKPTGALLSLFPNGMTALKYILGNSQTTKNARFIDILNEQSVPLQRTIIKQVRGGKVSDERIVKAVENLNEGKSPGRFILWYQLQNILLEALAAVSEDENGLSLGCDFQCYSFDNSTGFDLW